MALNDGRVVSNFIVQALSGQPLTIYGDGSQTRSFCYVSDLVEGLIELMEQEEILGPVNLGNPHEMTMKELAQHVIAMTGPKSSIQYNPLPADDPVKRRPDTTLARTRLGWEPRVPLSEGLPRTVDYFRKRMKVPTESG